jgi:hypothetical protein
MRHPAFCAFVDEEDRIDFSDRINDRYNLRFSYVSLLGLSQTQILDIALKSQEIVSLIDRENKERKQQALDQLEVIAKTAQEEVSND